MGLQVSGFGCQETEVRGQKTEDRCRKKDDRNHKSEDRGINLKPEFGKFVNISSLKIDIIPLFDIRQSTFDILIP